MNRSASPLPSLALLLATVAAGCADTNGPVDDPSTGDDGITTCAHGPTVEGVDVSEFQGTIDWNAVKASGRGFGIARVADGVQHLDPTFDRNWSDMKAAGVVRGVYQFFRPGQDGTAQANLLLAHVMLEPGDLAPVLDVEVTDGYGAATINANIASWTARIRDATGRTPIIYTAPGFWNGVGDPSFGDDTLWVAHWDAACPDVPRGWSDWTFWQYADDGHVPGIGPLVDLDRFNGSLGDLTGGNGGSLSVRSAPVAVGKNLDGRLEAFVPGADHQLWHQWQSSTGGWSGFWPMTGNMTDAPAVAQNEDGRLEVFVRGFDAQLWHQWQLAPNGGWSGFVPMTGNMTDSPVVAQNQDGRLEVFVRGSDGQVWHQWQATPGGAWSGFAAMGGNVTGSPAVAQNHDGRLEVFVRGSDGQVWHQWQATPGGTWSGFWPLGGQITDEPAVGQNADGRLEVFVRGSDGQLWHDWQASTGGWSGFWPMGGQVTNAPSVARNADGRLEVFARGSDGQLWHQWQGGPNGGWSGFWPLGGQITDAPTAAANADGRLELFVRGSDGQLWHQWQITPNGSWSGFWALGGQIAP